MGELDTVQQLFWGGTHQSVVTMELNFSGNVAIYSRYRHDSHHSQANVGVETLGDFFFPKVWHRFCGYVHPYKLYRMGSCPWCPTSPLLFKCWHTPLLAFWPRPAGRVPHNKGALSGDRMASKLVWLCPSSLGRKCLAVWEVPVVWKNGFGGKMGLEFSLSYFY